MGSAVGIFVSGPRRDFLVAYSTLACRRIVLESDDRSLFSNFFITFGGDEPSSVASSDDAFLRVSVEAPLPDSPGLLRIWHSGRPLEIEHFFFGLEMPGCPYVSLRSGKEIQIAFRGSEAAQFMYAGTECHIRHSSVWREAVIALLWRGFLSLMDQAIFFHAASIGISGKGYFFIGTQHSGKSTLALALASRGNEFLGDDIGCYLPAQHRMLPYRRPVGIREGPRARAVANALQTRTYRSMQGDDSLRVDPNALLGLGPERELPVDGVVFLRGFAEQPSLKQIEAGAQEVSRLQTLYSSLSNATPQRRLLELIRLTSRARIFELIIGDPDETAAYVEGGFLAS